MKIYATTDQNDFEPFVGRDLWIKCAFQDPVWGMTFHDYINVIDMDARHITFRSVDNDFINGESYWHFAEPEMVSWGLERFLSKYTIAQPLTLISTNDMEEILNTKLTHIEDWYN